MKTLGDKLHVGHGFRDEHDQRLEPEEQPVRRELTSEGMVNGTVDGRIADLSVPVSVQADMTALEAARAISQQCRFCEHWRPDEFEREFPLLDRADRDALLRTALDLDLDPKAPIPVDAMKRAEIAVSCLGKCMALSGRNAPADSIFSHPEAACPSTGPAGQPLPLMFKPRSDARRVEAQIRDRVLRMAQGRDVA